MKTDLVKWKYFKSKHLRKAETTLVKQVCILSLSSHYSPCYCLKKLKLNFLVFFLIFFFYLCTGGDIKRNVALSPSPLSAHKRSDTQLNCQTQTHQSFYSLSRAQHRFYHGNVKMACKYYRFLNKSWTSWRVETSGSIRTCTLSHMHACAPLGGLHAQMKTTRDTKRLLSRRRSRAIKITTRPLPLPDCHGECRSNIN